MSMLRPTSPSNAIVWSRKRGGSVVRAASVMVMSFGLVHLAPLAGRGRIASQDAIRVSGTLRESECAEAAPHPNPLPAKSGEREERQLRRHAMQRAELVAIGIAQIGDVQLDAAAFADARRILAGLAAMSEAGGMKRIGGID